LSRSCSSSCRRSRTSWVKGWRSLEKSFPWQFWSSSAFGGSCSCGPGLPPEAASRCRCRGSEPLRRPGRENYISIPGALCAGCTGIAGTPSAAQEERGSLLICRGPRIRKGSLPQLPRLNGGEATLTVGLLAGKARETTRKSVHTFSAVTRELLAARRDRWRAGPGLALVTLLEPSRSVRARRQCHETLGYGADGGPPPA